MPWHPRANNIPRLLDRDGQVADKLVRGGEYTYRVAKPSFDHSEYQLVLVSEAEYEKERPEFAFSKDAQNYNGWTRVQCTFVVPDTLPQSEVLIGFAPRDEEAGGENLGYGSTVVYKVQSSE